MFFTYFSHPCLPFATGNKKLNEQKYQWCIIHLTCSHPELTKDHVLTSACVIIFRAVTRNAVNKSVWRKKTLLDFPSTNMQ